MTTDNTQAELEKLLHEEYAFTREHPVTMKLVADLNKLTEAHTNTRINEVLSNLEKHIGDLHMERVGIPDIDTHTPAVEAERRRFSEAIKEQRKRLKEGL